MKIILLYLYVRSRVDPAAPPPIYYSPFSARFRRTYNDYRPPIDHTLLVASCGGPMDDAGLSLFGDVDHKTVYYGTGWDIGAHQSIASYLDCDLVVCASSHVYFWRNDWLSRIADAFAIFGDGLYGLQASLECHPHIRTPCFAVSPHILRAYPHRIDSRDKCFFFESGGNHSMWDLWNFSSFVKSRYYPVKLVAADGIYNLENCREPNNVFRRGNQTNCLVWDNHNDIWLTNNHFNRQVTSLAADGIDIPHNNGTQTAA